MNTERFVGSCTIRVLTLLAWLTVLVLVAVLGINPTHPTIGWMKVGGILCAFLALLGSIHCFQFTYTKWMMIASTMNKVVSTSLFGMIYLFIVPPFAIIARWLDPLRLRRGGNATTFWIRRKQQPVNPDSLQRMS